MLSTKYRAIDTDVYTARIESKLTDLGIQFTKTSYAIGRNGSKHRVTYTLTNQETRIMGDVVRPQIVVANSYDGSMAFTISMGIYRLICTNGLIVGDGWYHERIVHVQGPTIERKLKELDYQIAAFMPNFSQFVAKMHEKLGIVLPKTKQHEILDELKLPSTIYELASYRIDHPEREQDSTNTVWSLWNIVNEANTDKSRTANGAFGRDAVLLDRIIKLAA